MKQIVGGRLNDFYFSEDGLAISFGKQVLQYDREFSLLDIYTAKAEIASMIGVTSFIDREGQQY
jgi:hypothetical protein